MLAGMCVSLPALSFAAEESEVGKHLFLRYCSACHGETAKGDGIVSQLMSPKPADLTQLAKKSAEGKFPFDAVVRSIDGRETVRAHGDPDMPVWGELFEAEAEAKAAPDPRTTARGKVVLITDYIESIQAK